MSVFKLILLILQSQYYVLNGAQILLKNFISHIPRGPALASVRKLFLWNISQQTELTFDIDYVHTSAQKF